MNTWTLPLELDPLSEQPLFLQLARAIASDVRRGRLRPGAGLPGSRTLATTLGVHRNTVLAAYHELQAEGWIEAKPRLGVVVSSALPDAKPRRFAPASQTRESTSRAMPIELHAGPELREWRPDPKGALIMNGGIPDVSMVPIEPLARAYRRTLLRQSHDVLSYGDPRGHKRLRAELAATLAATRGLAITEDELVLTRGSQMALDLVARSLLTSGDRVAVESFGYGPAWEAFRQAGSELVPIPVDEEGLVVADLEKLVQAKPIRAVYVTPHHQYPTTVAMTAGRRLALLALARKHRFMIIEDDYHHEFHYEGRPVLPLASADAGVVAYIGSLSKVLAPGLRIGYVVAPRPLLERVTLHRVYSDRQGDQTLECALAELFQGGDVQRHIRRAKRVYQARRDFLAAELRRRLGGVVSFKMPVGGMAIWTRVSADVNVETWSGRAGQRGVVFMTGRSFAFDRKPRPYIRLGFGGLAEPQLRDAVKRMAESLG